MALATLLDTLDGIDDAMKAHYTENNGKFVLQISGVDSHPDVANLKSAYERVKVDKAELATERDALKAKAAGYPDDFDPEKWAKAKDGKPDEAALVALRQELEAERDEWKAKAETASETARRNALDRDLSDALMDSGVTTPSFVEAARMMISGDVKISDEGKPFVDTDMGPLPLSEHVKRWAASDKGKPFVTPPKGGGSGGNNGGSASMTREQFAALGDKDRTQLYRDDPEKFRELSGQK